MTGSSSTNRDVSFWYRHLPKPPADGQQLPIDSDDDDDYEVRSDLRPSCLPPGVSAGDFVKMHPFYTARTLDDGGEVVNAESIREHQMRSVLKHVWFDCPDEPYEDEGPPAFAFHYRGIEEGGVVLAVNHPAILVSKESGSSSGSPSLPQNVIDLNSHILATISGKLEESNGLLKSLKNKYYWLEEEKGTTEISVAEVAQLLADVLAYRCEVGLVAGWDYVTGFTKLYRVDGMGVLIKGYRFATGSGLDYAYNDLGKEKYGGYWTWNFPLALRAIVHVAYESRKDQVDRGWGLRATKGEDFVSVYYVDESGWSILNEGVHVKSSVQSYGLRRFGPDEDFIF